MPRGYVNGVAEVTVKIRFYHDSPEARATLMEELKRSFDITTVNAGYWGFDRIGYGTKVKITKESK